MSNNSNNARIAKNTLFLYFRMILLMGVSLYTSRVVLSTLGVEDYGIYNVVGGFVSMVAFLNGAMSSCTQRFITIALGRGNISDLKKTFSTCVAVHFIIALLVLIIAETVGLWFVVNKLVIPPDRINAALAVYHCSVIVMFLQIMSFPYNADIIANEKMSAFAYISIYEAFANLIIVFLLKLFSIDKLLLYGILLLIVKSSVILVYRTYCKRKFVESTFKWSLDLTLLKEMVAFTGWNLWGGMAATLMGQGVNILLNVFFGPTVNAARALAVQVQSAVNLFSYNFQMAINPQIIKTYAASDFRAMHVLVYRSTKFTFMLLLCLILPITLEINTILSIWLEEVPQYTNTFVCLMLYICLLDAVSNPLMTSATATGQVKKYQSVVGGILLLIVPVAYLVLKLGGNPSSVFIVHFIIASIAFVVRLVIVKNLINLSIRQYFTEVIIPCLKVAIPSIIISILIKFVTSSGLGSAILTVLTSIFVVLLCSYLFGLSKNEKLFIKDMITIRL